MAAIDRALARVVTLRTACAETSNPKSCVKSINAAVECNKSFAYFNGKYIT